MSKKTSKSAVDFGTSPHGLAVGLPRTNQKTRKAGGLHSLADGFEFRGGEARRPDVCAPRRTPEAASKLPQFHYLELTECEFLHLHAAVEHGRNRDRRAIKKGFAVPEDLQATDSLWHKLGEIQVIRMRGVKA
jgi:hypothetical protein